MSADVVRRAAPFAVAVLGSLLPGLEWTNVVLIVTVVTIMVGAVCWTVADPERPARLARLIAVALPGRRNDPEDRR